MLKTLHGYIGKELLRITMLALVAFTLLMTVFAILEPLRKEGLGTGQIAALFLYTMPVMLSFTLPFSALFATSMVYGRFAMDREFLACRASGISFLEVLKPAIWLGAGVMLVSLVLINFVSPPMFKAGEEEVMRNIKRIVYNRIHKDSFVGFDKNLMHASRVDEDNDILYGCVMARVEYSRSKDPAIPFVFNITMVTSEYAKLSTSKQDGQHTITLEPFEVVGPISNIPAGHAESQQVQLEELSNIPLPAGMKEKPAGYTWGRLLATYDNPTLHPQVSRALEKYVWEVRVDRFAVRSAQTIKEGKAIMELQGKDVQYEIYAPRCRRKKDSVYFERTEDAPGKPGQRVKLIRRQDGREFRYEADVLQVYYRKKNDMVKPGVTMGISGHVLQTLPRVEGTMESPTLPAIGVPRDDMLDSRPRGDLLKHPEKYTTNEPLVARINLFRTKGLVKIKRKILAEMHWRICYGCSCLAMVILGAILGILNRGGQLLIAFATAVIPLVIVLVLAIMGRNMISNPSNNVVSGVVLMWGGIVVVAGLDIWFFNRLRKA